MISTLGVGSPGIRKCQGNCQGIVDLIALQPHLQQNRRLTSHGVQSGHWSTWRVGDIDDRALLANRGGRIWWDWD